MQFNHDQDADDFLTDKELRTVEQNEYVQFNHDKDEDDFLDDKDLRSVERMNDAANVQFNHEQDTDDIDIDTAAPEMRGSARQRMEEDENWTKFFQTKGKINEDEVDWDKTNVQLSDNLVPRKKGEPFLYESELAMVDTEDKAQKLSDEVQGIMDEQAREDSMNVQLGYAHIPHADDTEDIVEEDEKSYDHHHSKEWNALVDKKAQELEDFMQKEEKDKIAAKKAAEEAKRKAIEEKAKQEAEKRK